MIFQRPFHVSCLDNKVISGPKVSYQHLPHLVLDRKKSPFLPTTCDLNRGEWWRRFSFTWKSSQIDPVGQKLYEILSQKKHDSCFFFHRWVGSWTHPQGFFSPILWRITWDKNTVPPHRSPTVTTNDRVFKPMLWTRASSLAEAEGGLMMIHNPPTKKFTKEFFRYLTWRYQIPYIYIIYTAIFWGWVFRKKKLYIQLISVRISPL